jgi:pimeloyl-ACP methyl ester carboxylesterase
VNTDAERTLEMIRTRRCKVVLLGHRAKKVFTKHWDITADVDRALEAALLTASVRRLVLYEPTLPPSGASAETIERMQGLIDVGDPAEALRLFYRDVLRLSPADLADLQASPRWPEKVAVAHTIPRELQGLNAYRFEPARFRALQAPTLLLVGGDSMPFRRTVAETIAAAVPNSRIGVLPGQRHGAIEAAPELFAQEVMRFLTLDVSARGLA